MVQQGNLAEVCVVVPALNEASRITSLIDQLIDLGYPHIVVVNDGSSDETGEILSAYESVVVIHHMINLGAGAATMSGIQYALTRPNIKYVATIDADLQHNPQDIINLYIQANAQEVDLMIGSRFLQNNPIPRSRQFYNRIGNVISYFKSGKMVSDSQSGIKVLSRRFAENLEITYNGFEHCIEMIHQAHIKGYSISEFPVSVRYTRETMQKGQNFRNGIYMVIRLLNPFT